MDIENKKQLVSQYSNMDVVIQKAKMLLGDDCVFELEISQKKDYKYKIRGEFNNNKWVNFGRMYYKERYTGKKKCCEDHTKNYMIIIDEFTDDIADYWIGIKKKYNPVWFEYYLLYYCGDLKNIPAIVDDNIINDIINKKQLVSQYSNMDIVIQNAKILLEDENVYELEISQRKNYKYKIRGEFTNDKWVYFGKMYYEERFTGLLRYCEDYTKNFNKKIRDDAAHRVLYLSSKYVEKKYNPSWFEYYLLYYGGDLKNIPAIVDTSILSYPKKFQQQ